MASAPAHELLLIRHAPALNGGRLAGRRDVPADLGDGQAVAALRAHLGPVDQVITSPALRCRQTAQAMWADTVMPEDTRLWEQDFGAWEGLPFAEIPDQGALSPAELALLAPPGGESFADLCLRLAPALTEIATLPGRTAIIAHAGTIRAALAMALGTMGGTMGPALAFSIDPLSITRLIPCGQQWAIGGVNQKACP
ncbi:histidine phosphatase family protein [Novosphingobium terrae]|uniref:histidine phosphatase family protein n=1 Tax=Novosphingobium terrae TaxID=2726189 RepID=UPI0019804E87|nr:histidine phosphatase family protein [Novosphingobium terrae]